MIWLTLITLIFTRTAGGCNVVTVPPPTERFALLKSINEAPTELAEAIREFFPEPEWDNAASISYLESGWSPFAEANTTTAAAPCGTTVAYRSGFRISAERSIGWFQINACNLPPEWNPCHLFNTRHNVGTAHMMWDNAGGWLPWAISAEALGLSKPV